MKTTLTLITVFAFLFVVSQTHAHPGRTDSSDGHTCRSNCESWGLDYGEYHSHGGYEAPAIAEQNIKPTDEDWYAHPEYEEYITPTDQATETPTDEPTPEPTQPTTEPKAASEASGDTPGTGLLGLAALGGLGYFGWKKLKGKKKANPPAR